MHETTVAVLHAYAKRRLQLLPELASPAFFFSAAGTRVLYCNFHLGFQELVRRAGIEARSRSCGPRPHDYADVHVMPMFPRTSCSPVVSARKLSA